MKIQTALAAVALIVVTGCTTASPITGTVVTTDRISRTFGSYDVTVRMILPDGQEVTCICSDTAQATCSTLRKGDKISAQLEHAAGTSEEKLALVKILAS